jgi:hypothetical protein
MEFGYFLQDLIARGNTAYSAENWNDAIKYYEAMAKAVPDAATSFSHLCVAYAKVEKLEAAAANCEKATTLQGAKVFDHLRFLDLTLRKSELTPQDIEAVEASLKQLREHVAKNPPPLPGEHATNPPQMREEEASLIAGVRDEIRKRRQADGQPQMQEATPKKEAIDEEEKHPSAYLPVEIELRNCKFSALIGDDQRLSSCITALREFKVNERLVLPFSWAQALLHKDESQADKLLKEAGELGVSSSALRTMQDEQDKVFPHFKRYLRWGAVGLIGTIALLAGLCAIRRRSSASNAASEARA